MHICGGYFKLVADISNLWRIFQTHVLIGQNYPVVSYYGFKVKWKKSLANLDTFHETKCI